MTARISEQQMRCSEFLIVVPNLHYTYFPFQLQAYHTWLTRALHFSMLNCWWQWLVK